VYPSYPEILKDVSMADRVAPRGQATRELLRQTVVFDADEIVSRRGFSPALAFAEALQVVSGLFDPDIIKEKAPRANHDMFTAAMAYGPRINEQMQGVLDTLNADPASREAFVTVGRPLEAGKFGAIPCMESVQFLIRDEFLITVVTHRSWDACTGLPYNVVIDGLLAQVVANLLGVYPGTVVVNAASLHVYETQIEAGRLEGARDYGRFEIEELWTRSWQGARSWAVDQLYSDWGGEIAPRGIHVEKFPKPEAQGCATS
jgi:hypothetical protein